MYNLFGKFRFFSWIAIVCSLLGSLLMFVIGSMKTYYAFSAVFFLSAPKESLSHLEFSDIATTYLIKSLDAFLIALVLFIFAYGVYSLFISNKKTEQVYSVLRWIHMPSISHLKNVLAELIIIVLFVKFLEIALVNLKNLSWTIMALPLSILMLAISLKFLALKHDSGRSKAKEENSD